MKIIVGHSNMDLDCIGSIVLAKYLFTDYMPVKSRLIHPRRAGTFIICTRTILPF